MTVEYEETLKPAEVETPLDRRFFRPIAHLFVQVAMPTPLGANGVTLIGVLVGVCGASLLRYPSARQVVPGALLLVVYAIFDCADGQLARARGTSSRLGRILDGLSDHLVGAGSCAAIAAHVGASALVTILGFACVLAQGAMSDHFTNRYLTRSNATYREGDDLDETRAAIEAGGPPLEIALYRGYALYLRVQRMFGRPSGDGPLPANQAFAFEGELAPIASGWAYLGSSTHIALMGAFACLGFPSAYVWLRLTVANVAAAVLYVEEHRREKELAMRFAPPPDPLGPVPGMIAAPPRTPLPPPPAREERAPISFRPPPPDD